MLQSYMFNAVIPIVLFSVFGFANLASQPVAIQPQIMATHTISLDERYADASVNDVFRYNILLTLAYLRSSLKDTHSIDFNEVEKPFEFDLTLKPGETFAYHEDVLPEYKNSLKYYTGAHFGGDQGFRSDGYLMGDGVCHLASLIYLVAQKAGLEAKSPVNHNFANIPQIPREYGVSIYYMPGQEVANAAQNMYVKNTFDTEVTFKYTYDGHDLTVSIVK